jgi:BTB And C-terminal Kelch/Kelch motif
MYLLRWQVICQQNEFLNLPVAHLARILHDDNVEVEYEEYVYEALKRWIMHDCPGRLSYLAELFAAIRLNFVSRWYLIEVITNDTLLAESSDCRRLIHSAKDQLLAAGHTYDVPWQLPPSRRTTGLTSKLVFIATTDPEPGESPVLLFDVVNRSWSRASRPCPLASEFSTCTTVNGDTLLVIGGWTNRAATRSLKDARGAVSTVHEFRVMSIFPTLWYVGAHVMGISRYLHSTVTVDNKIYLLGGYDETQSLQVFVGDIL